MVRKVTPIKPYAAYERESVPTEDAELTHVERGSPAGELLRRFWQPVALSSELGELPIKVRMFGEDLVRFRAGNGQVGLLETHCSHRGHPARSRRRPTGPRPATGEAPSAGPPCQVRSTTTPRVRNATCSHARPRRPRLGINRAQGRRPDFGARISASAVAATTAASPGSATSSTEPARRHSVPRAHGPVIARVMPGVYRLTNSVCPSGLNTEPAHSVSR